ncbi:MAG: (d)CMP kinase [Acidobacteriota bacterium]
MSDSTPVRRLIVAIDGPSGAGKGTIARAVATRLHYRHIDTGAMYRALAWKADRQGADLSDDPTVSKLAEETELDVGEGRVRVDGHDVAAAIRTPAIDSAAAAVARLPGVRAALIARQREMGAGGGVVMEGRDIGTVVFPSAEVKIFLDASPEERARRRASDPAHSAGSSEIRDVAIALAERDRSDRTRAASPLTQAPDAVVVDTTGLSIDEAVARVLEVVYSRSL